MLKSNTVQTEKLTAQCRSRLTLVPVGWIWRKHEDSQCVQVNKPHAMSNPLTVQHLTWSPPANEQQEATKCFVFVIQRTANMLLVPFPDFMLREQTR